MIRNTLLLILSLLAVNAMASSITPQTYPHTFVAVYRETGDYHVTYAILKYAYEFKLPPALLVAIAHTESGYDPKTVSSNDTSKDYGLFQLNSLAFKDYTKKELMTLDTNVRFAAAYLAYLNKRYKGNVKKMCYAYNAGVSRVTKNKIPYSTIAYHNKVVAKLNELVVKFPK